VGGVLGLLEFGHFSISRRVIKTGTIKQQSNKFL